MVKESDPGPHRNAESSQWEPEAICGEHQPELASFEFQPFLFDFDNLKDEVNIESQQNTLKNQHQGLYDQLKSPRGVDTHGHECNGAGSQGHDDNRQYKVLHFSHVIGNVFVQNQLAEQLKVAKTLRKWRRKKRASSQAKQVRGWWGGLYQRETKQSNNDGVRDANWNTFLLIICPMDTACCQTHEH